MVDIKQQIALKLAAMLAEHGADWIKPWTAAGAQRNAETDRPYRGSNAFLTGLSPFESPYWHTYKGWSRMGHQIAKGSKSLPIVFWKVCKSKEDDKTFMMAKSYNVFNSEQLDGEFHKPVVETFEHDPIEHAEQIITQTGAAIEHNANGRAYYQTSTDSIVLPLRESFHAADGYYSTAFHELGHWTGAEARLDRKLSGGFGSPEYAFEELIAEACAAFLCVETGVSSEPRPDHAKYINNWITACSEQPNLITSAFSKAQKAADYVLGVKATAQAIAA